MFPVRTTIRYDYSYITSAALQIGTELMEVASFGDYILNGVNAAALERVELSGFPVIHDYNPTIKKHTFDVQIGYNENVTISVYKDLVAVDIVGGSPEHFGNSVGLLGDFHSGSMIGRDGETILEDANAFGGEWQVNVDEPMLFQVSRAPQYPNSCRLPTESQMQVRRRLGENKATQSAAEKACAHLVAEMKKACIYDVVAIGDICVADGY